MTAYAREPPSSSTVHHQRRGPRTIKNASDQTMPRSVAPDERTRRPKYWWNAAIAEKRNECNKVTRWATRSAKHRGAAAELYQNQWKVER